ncbi:MAG: type II toxin-antitoxin system RelE/ParE family toxin [Desulfomonile sp.]|nr:type II toxin-antitoxin system RelE/ParE family toxin [Desulfomonile sp.]
MRQHSALSKALFQVVDRLSDFPDSGRMVPEFGDVAIREVIRRPCRIVYRVDREKRLVEIVRVRHAARGIPDVE